MATNQKEVFERAKIVRSSQINGNPVVQRMMATIDEEIGKLDQIWHKKTPDEVIRLAAQKNALVKAKKTFDDACHLTAVAQIEAEKELVE